MLHIARMTLMLAETRSSMDRSLRIADPDCMIGADHSAAAALMNIVPNSMRCLGTLGACTRDSDGTGDWIWTTRILGLRSPEPNVT